LAQDLQGEAGVGQDIVGLGVALAGRVDRTGTVYFAPDLETAEHRWNEVALEAELEEATRIRAFDHSGNRVVVENDANALGMYEYLLQGADESVVVVLMSESGEGIGSGLVINRAIAHGVEGVSGEIGHVVVDPAGEPCRCGARGCLETVASGAAIIKVIKETTAVPIASLAEASALVERRDQAATKVFASAGEALGRVLSIVTATVGPRHLVIVGPPQLTQETDVTSARAFLQGVRQTQSPAFLGVKVDILPKVLDPATLPTAAAATAIHHFLSRPRHWIPTIVGLDVPSGQWRSRERVGVRMPVNSPAATSRRS
jgi:predicted NBD/HSP70 family sugar kinase